MNETNDKKVIGSKLDSLTEEQRSYVLEMAANARLIDMVEVLKEFGVVTTVSTVSRFLQRDREKRLLADGKAMKEAVAELAERGKDGALREGSLEAVRQRLYERVLLSNDPKEALALYNAMLMEEGKLKALELEARKVAVAEEQVRLQRLKLAARGRKKAVVESSQAVLEDGGEAIVAAGIGDRERLLLELVGDLSGILNRGGDAQEKVNEARGRLGEGVRLLGNGACE